MFDMQARQNFLRESAAMLDEIYDRFDDEVFAFEHAEPFTSFAESARAFSEQFKARAAMYDEPQFANASSDAELRDAASNRHERAWHIIKFLHATDATRAHLAEHQFVECDFILHAIEQRECREGSDGLE